LSQEVIAALMQAFPLIVPEILLVLGACIVFVGGTFRNDRHLWGVVALATLILAGVVSWRSPPSPISPASLYASSIFVDEPALLIRWLALIGGAVLVLVSWNAISDSLAGEYHGCLLLIIAGLSLTGSANDLVTLFLALELTSIPTYILLYLFRIDPAAQEAAMKYFLLSVFSSALVLFGFSYLYGLGGTTNIPALADALTQGDENGVISSRLPAVVLIALVMIVSGLGFRITAVPFHFYAPDVYQGTATPAAALLAFVPKVAGFITLLRVLGFIGLDPRTNGLTLGTETPVFLWILAAFTMSLGNMLALLQSNLKRLLAYSSVAHAGYMLVALAGAHHVSGSEKVSAHSGLGGAPAVLFYLAAYGGMTIGAFAVLVYLSTPERPVENEDDLAGLSRTHPGLALMMTLFLFSLIGIPLTAGFVGKLLIFLGALSVEGDRAIFYRELALIMAINAAVGAWYYLRIVTKMYLHTPIKPLEPAKASQSWPVLAALWICTVLTLGLGLPNPLTNRIVQMASAPSIPQESGSALASNRLGEEK
jgi:NADH-quinone oxidoreductase subunit N